MLAKKEGSCDQNGANFSEKFTRSEDVKNADWW